MNKTDVKNELSSCPSLIIHAPCSMVYGQKDFNVAVGRIGECLIGWLYSGMRMSHKSPFDVKNHSWLIEVKTMNENGRDMKVNISKNSFKRKIRMMKRMRMNSILVVVMICSDRFEVYESELRQSIRVNQMKKVSVIMR